VNKLRIVTVVGTRPEIIRLSRVLARLQAEPAVEHSLIHTGQNYDYELNEIFFSDLEIKKPDYYLEAAGSSPAETIGMVISRIDPILEKIQPDAFLLLGDTNSCLSAIAAKRRKIPVFHMEAGNRCFDQRVPEEINRKIVDHLSDINMPYSAIAREYLLREGIPADRVIRTGSPMFEVLSYYAAKISRSTVLRTLGVASGKFYLVSAHREENIDTPVQFKRLVDLLNTLAERDGQPVIVTTHPRTRKRCEAEKVHLHENVVLVKPFGLCDYVHLQQHATAVLSDSGTITEESSILNFPAVNIRDAHERPEGMEEASVMMTGLNKDRIFQALSILAGQKRGPERTLQMVRDYDVPSVSEKVLRIIVSYTDYVNRTVWERPV
jgi:UDP-N-acetyl-L-fucosamine synthase